MTFVVPVPGVYVLYVGVRSSVSGAEDSKQIEACMWTMLNTYSTIVDYCLKKNSIYAQVSQLPPGLLTILLKFIIDRRMIR